MLLASGVLAKGMPGLFVGALGCVRGALVFVSACFSTSERHAPMAEPCHACNIFLR